MIAFGRCAGLILFAGQMTDRRRRHASLVAVWTEVKTDDAGREYRLNVTNQGGQPIYDCRLTSTLSLYAPVEEAEEPVDIRSEINLAWGTIAPGDHIANVAFLRVGQVRGPLNLDDLVNRALKFRVTFTDTEGRSWARDEHGRLRRTRA
jgi:hypothetical protein